MAHSRQTQHPKQDVVRALLGTTRSHGHLLRCAAGFVFHLAVVPSHRPLSFEIYSLATHPILLADNCHQSHCIRRDAGCSVTRVNLPPPKEIAISGFLVLFFFLLPSNTLTL